MYRLPFHFWEQQPDVHGLCPKRTTPCVELQGGPWLQFRLVGTFYLCSKNLFLTATAFQGFAAEAPFQLMF